MLGARFPDFLEALCRVTLFKVRARTQARSARSPRHKLCTAQCIPPLAFRAVQAYPTMEEIESAGCKGCGEYLDKLTADGAIKAWRQNNSVRWQEEEGGGRNIEDVLDKLLNAVIHRLDTDKNGVVTLNDFTLAAKV